MMAIPGIEPDTRIHSRILQQPLASPRRGVMLHYDDSSPDDWAVEWFSDPRCTNGYTWLVLDDDAARAHLVGHDEEAIWTPAYTSKRELWGRLGRKVDPTGQRKDGQPIVGLAEVTTIDSLAS